MFKAHFPKIGNVVQQVKWVSLSLTHARARARTHTHTQNITQRQHGNLKSQSFPFSGKKVE